MLSFSRDGSNNVISTIELDVPIEKRHYPFTWKTDSEIYAYLLVNKFNDTLQKNLKRIRQEAYTAGWLDAKGKHKKETWFSGWW